MASQAPGGMAPRRPVILETLNLSHARTLAGVSLDEIAASTKISVRFLKAIESEEFEKLPGGIFSTSYLRQYAAAIAYDQESLVRHYHVKMNLPIPGAESQEESGRSRRERWFRIPAQASRQL